MLSKGLTGLSQCCEWVDGFTGGGDGRLSAEPIDNLSNIDLICGQFIWKMKNIQDYYLLVILIKRTKHENRFADQCWIMVDLTIIPYFRITTLTS